MAGAEGFTVSATTDSAPRVLTVPRQISGLSTLTSALAPSHWRYCCGVRVAVPLTPAVAALTMTSLDPDPVAARSS
jgi:hypothetical protein